MNVHIIRDTDFPVEQYEQVMKLLQATPGLISFIRTKDNLASAALALSSGEHVGERMSVNQKGKLTARREHFLGHSFSYFFNHCDAYRERWTIPSKDFVILLTPESNSLQHLAAFQDDALNVFIKTSEWGEYLDCSAIYPITFTVMTQVLHKLYCKTMYARRSLHDKAEGCIGDYCRNKEEVIFKFRTADICMKCINGMIAAGVSQEYLLQAFPLFEKMRYEMLFKQKYEFVLRHRRIHISRSTGRSQGITVSFPDINKHVKLNPKRATLYLFFLIHPNGVALSDLEKPDYYEKLKYLYSNLYSRTAKNKQAYAGDEEIDDAFENKRMLNVDNVVNSFVFKDEKKKGPFTELTNIRKEFKKQLGDAEAVEYYIDTLPHTDTMPSTKKVVKGIRVNAKLVTYDNDVKDYILGKYCPDVDALA
ncbi:hypothetical protein [Pontibacter sp. BAB1700]|uniref:hypothetical protein n=1 Tax=Pontibacter sp. BAB1700 TaxID=1144253 RepID=UPI00026BC990|nr:hypothetical protein [Pontibacter sp. BAB1700]EJF10604.1 hypothetical protein O71_08193 [Pontibacter sp. BAB1700]